MRVEPKLSHHRRKKGLSAVKIIPRENPGTLLPQIWKNLFFCSSPYCSF
jgi:hypothetical protein